VKNHTIRVYASSENLPKEEQFAYKLARMASDDAPIDPASEEMVINRIVDNASVAMASVNRTPVENARSQALAHPRSGGATVFDLPAQVQKRPLCAHVPGLGGGYRHDAWTGYGHHFPIGQSGRTRFFLDSPVA
jgi:hypothetical protein